MAAVTLKTRRGYLALLCVLVILIVGILTVDRQAMLEWLAQQQADAVAYTQQHLWQAIAIATEVAIASFRHCRHWQDSHYVWH